MSEVLENNEVNNTSSVNEENVKPEADADAQVKTEKTKIDEIKNNVPVITAEERVRIARCMERPSAEEYINALFDDFFEIHGDKLCYDDASIVGGIATFHDIPVTVIGQKRGHSVEDNMKINFGMTSPEGYRKAMRLMKQAEKFGRPVITFVDTPGAYPGDEAEAHGQGEAIARNLAIMSDLKVPVITIVTGQGNSGGALALSVADEIWMLENSVYSILSPEGFASILWKDASRKGEACELMKLTANDLKNYGVIDEVIKEPKGGVHNNPAYVYKAIDKLLYKKLAGLLMTSPDALIKKRYKKYRNM